MSLTQKRFTQLIQTHVLTGKVLSFAMASVLLLAGCGGSSSGDGGGPEGSNGVSGDGTESTGVFLDSAVSNIDYTTTSGDTGSTSSGGEFNYIEGDSVRFNIGDIEFPEVTAKQIVTPLDMSDTRELDERVINIIRLLQTLDDDGDSSNGINISNATKTAAASITFNFDQSSSDFESNEVLTNFVSNSGANRTSLVPADEAEAHFRETLMAEGIPESVSNSLLGAHFVLDETGNRNGGTVFVFSNDGRFYLAELSASSLGYEAGTYSLTGNSINFNIGIDTNGDAGFANNEEFSTNPLSLQLQEQTSSEATFSINNGEGTVTANTVAKNTDGLAGSWRIQNDDEDLVIVFAGDDTEGQYLLVKTAPAKDSSVGIEFANYSISGGLTGGNGILETSPIFNSEGQTVMTGDGRLLTPDGRAGESFGIELNTNGTFSLSAPDRSDPEAFVRIDN